MTQDAAPPLRFGLRRMTARDPGERHRAASPLELFFDLVFVVAVSLSSQQLHHMESEGALGVAVLSYIMVFFTVWWAWMNFTWFGTSFAVDDWRDIGERGGRLERFVMPASLGEGPDE